MIEPLGNTSQSLQRIARRAAYIVGTRGECAIFLSLTTRQAYALTRSDPDWRTAVRRNATHLVGIYQPTAGDAQIAAWILDDLKEHERTPRNSPENRGVSSADRRAGGRRIVGMTISELTPRNSTNAMEVRHGEVA